MLGPIPGQSLTREPGSSDYENPPKLNTEEEIMDHYTEWLNEDGRLGEIFTLMEKGLPVSALSRLITRSQASKGVHSVDMSIVIRPMLHEYLYTLAKKEGINVVDSYQEKLKPTLDKQQEANAISFMAQNTEEEMAPVEEAPMPEKKPRGLMARRVEE